MKYKIISIGVIFLLAIIKIIEILLMEEVVIPFWGGMWHFYGFLAAIIKVLIIAVIIIVSYFISIFIGAYLEKGIKMIFRKKSKYFDFSHLEFKDVKLKENSIKRNAQLVEKIKTTDASFDEEFFLYHAKILFIKLQRDALMKYMKNLRGTWECAQSYVNYVYDNELIDIELPQIYFYSSSSDKDVIKVVLKSNIVYHVLELQDMSFIDINRDKIDETISIMTFMKWKKR